MSRISISIGFVALATFGFGAVSKTPPCFVGSVDPDCLDQTTVCAIVKDPSPAQPLIMDAVRGRDRLQVKVVAFDATVVEGGNLTAGSRIHLVCTERGLEMGPKATATETYLVVGWKARNNHLPVASVSYTDRMMGLNPVSINDADNRYFAASILPTAETTTVRGSNPNATALLNMVRALRNADPAVLRAGTSALEQIPDHYSLGAIEGHEPAQYMRELLRKELQKLPHTRALDLLRIDGILASWDRPKLAMAFLKSLPTLLEQVQKETPTPRLSPRADTEFVHFLWLAIGLDPNALLELAFSDPRMQWVALDPNVGKPNLANQKKLLSWVDSPDADVQAAVLNHFVAWYAEWDKWAQATLRPDGEGTEVVGFQALRAYWIKKINGPIPPLP